MRYEYHGRLVPDSMTQTERERERTAVLALHTSYTVTTTLIVAAVDCINSNYLISSLKGHLSFALRARIQKARTIQTTSNSPPTQLVQQSPTRPSQAVSSPSSSSSEVNQGGAVAAVDDQMLNFSHFYPVVSGPARVLTATPRPLVICGPSGSGKSTLLKKLMAEFNDCFGFSISHTTRKPRAGEVDGRDYYFTEKETMLKAIERGEFIEYTKFSENYYGTSKKAVTDVQNKGRICILDVEIEGVKNLKKTDLNPRFVFLKPPSMAVLEQRLRARGTESEEMILRRLEQAKNEIAYGEIPGNFDITIINDDVEEAYSNLRNFVIGVSVLTLNHSSSLSDDDFNLLTVTNHLNRFQFSFIPIEIYRTWKS